MRHRGGGLERAQLPGFDLTPFIDRLPTRNPLVRVHKDSWVDHENGRFIVRLRAFPDFQVGRVQARRKLGQIKLRETAPVQFQNQFVGFWQGPSRRRLSQVGAKALGARARLLTETYDAHGGVNAIYAAPFSALPKPRARWATGAVSLAHSGQVVRPKPSGANRIAGEPRVSGALGTSRRMDQPPVVAHLTIYVPWASLATAPDIFDGRGRRLSVWFARYRLSKPPKPKDDNVGTRNNHDVPIPGRSQKNGRIRLGTPIDRALVADKSDSKPPVVFIVDILTDEIR